MCMLQVREAALGSLISLLQPILPLATHLVAAGQGAATPTGASLQCSLHASSNQDNVRMLPSFKTGTAAPGRCLLFSTAAYGVYEALLLQLCVDESAVRLAQCIALHSRHNLPSFVMVMMNNSYL